MLRMQKQLRDIFSFWRNSAFCRFQARLIESFRFLSHIRLFSIHKTTLVYITWQQVLAAQVCMCYIYMCKHFVPSYTHFFRESLDVIFERFPVCDARKLALRFVERKYLSRTLEAFLGVLYIFFFCKLSVLRFFWMGFWSVECWILRELENLTYALQALFCDFDDRRYVHKCSWLIYNVEFIDDVYLASAFERDIHE